MDRKEIVNSQDYNATKVALCWYPTLMDEEREDMDIIDAYAEGVMYGWNNPQWIPVEERFPEKEEADQNVSVDVIVTDGKSCYTSHYNFSLKMWRWHENITHWMPLPAAPRKEG